LAVTQDGQITHARGFGTAGDGQPVTADTPMFIGSQTKSFTALGVMQLVEAGKLELDAPVQRYIPWFRVADEQSTAQITVRSLLNHSSGLAEAGYVPNLPDSASIEEAVRDLQRARPTARVGEKFQYFNPGYIILGYLVETLSGQSYGDYVRQHIFEPLEMASSSASIEEYAGIGLAQGYTQLFAFPVAMSQRIPAYYLPAGFIVSTASDMARYLMAMENNGELGNARILSAAGVRAMLTPNRAIQSYAGFGWDIFSYYGEPQIIHGGATERYYTQVVILPQSDFTAVMIINQDHMFKASYDYPALFWGAVDRLMGRPVTQQGISSVSIGWGLALAFIGIMIIEARGLLSLRKEPERLARLAPKGRWLRLLPHAIWSAATLLMVTVVGPALAGRSFDLRWFTGFYPDVALLAGVVLAAEALQAAVKAGLILARKPA
jgi:CubicO group peptidase (beta-lactamase class C family)